LGKNGVRSGSRGRTRSRGRRRRREEEMLASLKKIIMHQLGETPI